MADRPEVVLEPARVADAEVLGHLLELYIHDLSDVFPAIELGSDGRFGYPKLPLYWSEPERRFPFMIRADGGVAGFVLVTRGSPATEDPDVFDIAEFFVIRRHRRSGVGRRAANLLWSRLPGRWTVRVSRANPRALSFWAAAIGDVSGGAASERELPGNPNPWLVYSFDV